ncbi:MAG: decarboxylating 6-phosphogluconate dehydrogenase [Fusobacteria bacterium]|nr:decarboxylating 6-phosphogluconate dehydrogenase [Fusobacteriota bacterium]
MKLAILGLGRMGANMAKRLLQGGHEVVVFNRNFEKTMGLAEFGAIPARTIDEVIENLPSPKIVWLMLPAGKTTDAHILELSMKLSKGDIIVEGGNSYYKDDIARADMLKAFDINYIDAGVSGGVWGLQVGYCTMYGGEKAIFDYIEPIAKTLAPENGYLYCGETGGGHFTKMVHNGIEYAMMQSYGEGFELLKASKYGQNMNLEEVAKMWNNGSVIRSWLLELLENAFSKDGNLDEITGYVEDSGEARWTVKEAIDLGVAVDTITTALFKRFNSRQKDVFANKLTAALRNEFGGHAVVKKGEIDRRSEIVGAGIVEAARADKSRKF